MPCKSNIHLKYVLGKVKVPSESLKYKYIEKIDIIDELTSN